MKYHYKKPEEVKDTFKDRNKVHPYKNRTFLVIFADLLLIVVIAVFLDKSGYFTEDKIHSEGRYARSGVEFSASIVNFHKENSNLTFFVKLANFSGATVQFPGRKGDLSFTAPPEIEIYQGETSVKKQEIYFSRKTIEAEKEAYYKFKVPLSEHQLQNKKKYIYRIRIPVQSGEILIRFPVTE